MLQAAVVLEELRLVDVPVPKAGSTAILWVLAELAGLTSDDFADSRKLEVTRQLAVHDMSIWGRSHRLEGLSPKEVELILGSDEWFRFSVVREPVRRLWSAWVSKILMRDPRFVRTFGGEDWFPQQPSSWEDVVELFRQFVRILPRRPTDWHDPHWSPQVDLMGLADVEYSHAGRVEQLEDTFAVLRDYLSSRGAQLPLPERANPSLLPFVSGLLDASALDASNLWVACDREAFGYLPPAGAEEGPDERWRKVADTNIPAIRHRRAERADRGFAVRSQAQSVVLTSAVVRAPTTSTGPSSSHNTRPTAVPVASRRPASSIPGCVYT